MSEQPALVPENIEATIDLTAADIMPQGVPSVTLDTPVAEVLRLMVEHDVAGLAVVQGDEIVGIEDDVADRAGAGFDQLQREVAGPVL